MSFPHGREPSRDEGGADQHQQGNYHTPNGPGTFTPAAADGQNSKYFPRPKALLQGSRFYERSKPTYANVAAASVLSARSYGAAGDGKTDDTQALNALFKAASGNYSKQAIAFLDAGFYKVTGTVYVPPNTRIVGEGLAATIMGAGANYGNADQPLPVLQVGKAGESGYVEISDLLVSTQGSTPGAVLIEYNLASAAATSNCKAGSPPSGLWDVHVRVGGFQGSELQVAQCLKTPDVPSAKGPAVNSPCVAAHTSMHITKTAGNLYMENNWLWVADHDIEDANNTQITIFAARGLLIESEPGRLWLIGTAVEHHTLYQYQLVNTRDVFLGQLQTETPYYQPNPPAPFPFVPQPALADPDFAGDCAGAHATDGRLPVGTNQTAPCAMAWGLRVVDSADVVVFGAGLYSFFHNYNTSCSQRATGEACQARIFHAGPATLPPVPLSASGADARDISPVSAAEASGTPARMGALTVYNLDTVGALSMVTQGGRDVEGAGWAANFATFASTLALYVYGA